MYEIIEGLAESSYGIQVGKMAGLPKEVTTQAFNILSKLEQKDYNFFEASQQLRIGFNKKNKLEKSNLEKVSKYIKSIDINDTSPIEALKKLNEIQKKIMEFDDE